MDFKQVSMEDLDQLALTAADVLSQVRDAMIDPHPRKIAPSFNSSSIAELCRVDKTQIKYLTQKHDLPSGHKFEGSKAKEYTLEEAIQWVNVIGNRPIRPLGKKRKSYCCLQL